MLAMEECDSSEAGNTVVVIVDLEENRQGWGRIHEIDFDYSIHMAAVFECNTREAWAQPGNILNK